MTIAATTADRRRAVPALMVQGTHSNAGKSAIVTGLCRLAQRRGLNPAPFKPQNMALNSAVATDGGELSRAQALQAQAAGRPTSRNMNPLLLKPQADRVSELIVRGHSRGTVDARGYYALKESLVPEVLAAFAALAADSGAILIEGAGSPVEINLREGDIANMGFAELIDCPVLLVADIDCGGVFAQMLGTVELLAPSERRRLLGIIVNKFRGDPALLATSLEEFGRRLQVPILGLLPYLTDLYIEAEDSLAVPQSSSNGGFRVVCPAMPRLSNQGDFDPLRLSPDIDLLVSAQPIAGDLIILGGSKNVRSDLEFLRSSGWAEAIYSQLRYGGRVLGICGGFQMMGREILDSRGCEGPAGAATGLGLFNMVTELEAAKELGRVTGELLPSGAPCAGYEIHRGRSRGPALELAAARINGRDQGARSADGRLCGLYMHGLFDRPEAAAAVLDWAGCRRPVRAVDMAQKREEGIDRIADALQTHIDLTAVWRCLEAVEPGQKTMAPPGPPGL